MSEVPLPPLEKAKFTFGSETLVIEQASGLQGLVEQGIRAGDADLFWACVWPSARALATVLGDFGSLSGKRILELGCGPGLPGLVAAKLGATVILSDVRPEASALAARNAANNGLRVELLELDWNSPAPSLGTFDGILAADVLYGDGMLRGVLRFVRNHLAEDGVCLLTDPNRVPAAGVMGAARIAGLEANALALSPGGSLLGGVTLHQLQRRARLTS